MHYRNKHQGQWHSVGTIGVCPKTDIVVNVESYNGLNVYRIWLTESDLYLHKGLNGFEWLHHKHVTYMNLTQAKDLWKEYLQSFKKNWLKDGF